MRLSEWLWTLYGTVLSSATVFAAESVLLEDDSGANGGPWQILSGWLTRTLFEIGDVPVTSIGLIRVVVIITVAWWLSKLGQSALTRVAAYRPNFNQAALYTVKRLMHYVVLTVGFLIALSSIGIDLSKFALFASALGVGVGFGLQNLISNFVAGLMLLFEKSLKVGDFIELESGIMGEVREINIRSTIVTTNDNIDIVVPNSVFVNGHVTNWTMRDVYRRTHVPFGVAYGSDKELVRKAVLEAAANVPHTLEGDDKRQPQVWLTAFADSSLNFELIVWLTSAAVKRPGAVQADYLWAIETALKKYKIEIPFPQRDLHVRSWSPNARPPAQAAG
ncbi:MAG: mechanosensitive ion channel [Betaproteobacteria bacterium]|nr:mechanosensitive ion channel [Betaproteobacteria bacterium]MDH3438084.1 mechanosensitive ion channel [Betaproteobacteria bacterium]